MGQGAARRLDGGMVVWVRAQSGGRPITLEASEDHWLTRAQADALRVLAAAPGASYALSLRGESYTVVFRHHDAPALDLAPLVDYADTEAADPYTGVIKLMTL